MKEKTFDISEVKGAKKNISDLKVYGDGDTFALLCKASSQEEGWMKSTKVCNVVNGCIVQVTTQQRNPDGSYSVAEALTYVHGMNIDLESEPRKLAPIEYNTSSVEFEGEYNPCTVEFEGYEEAPCQCGCEPLANDSIVTNKTVNIYI